MKLTDNLFFYPECGMLDANTYIIKDDTNILIDPGSPQYLLALVRAMQQDGIEPGDINIIINTHLHLDHYGASEGFKKLSGARILLHAKQKEFYDLSVVKVAQFFGMPPQDYKEDALLDAVEFGKGSLGLDIIYAPGHSADSVCFYSQKAKFLICGDVIFCENTGRVDLPGGNARQLKDSIESLSKLYIEFLLPGHMDVISGAGAVKQNFQYVKDNVFRWL